MMHQRCNGWQDQRAPADEDYDSDEGVVATDRGKMHIIMKEDGEDIACEARMSSDCSYHCSYGYTVPIGMKAGLGEDLRARRVHHSM